LEPVTSFFENSKEIKLPVISGFRRGVEEICVLLRYYAASTGNPFLLGLLDL
jgi:hypothetical protein